jgi:(1->4)-alpha-D-glucan 1-alpha-D-glucosylmutase
MRWQQFTGPIMAKGLEDTALYVHHPLSSLNEVGGEPDGTGAAVSDLHARLGQQARRWPHTMTATSTHDTKRSEDVRARISVLSELAGEWAECLRRWGPWNEGKKTNLGGRLLPGRNEEYLLYQTLLGAWPLDHAELPGFPARVEQYMIKAAREAKAHTRWIRVNTPYEEALARFVRGVLDERRNRAFLRDFQALREKVAWYGALNALSQLLVKCAAPGVPDFYQGTELWNLRLVDPDNRAPVDFAARARALEELRGLERRREAPLAPELLTSWRDGRVKLFLTWKALGLRRRLPDLFADGAYLPLEVSGGKRDLVVAFARSRGDAHVLLAVPRFFTRLGAVGESPLGTEAWGARGAVALPPGLPETWRNVLTGEAVKAAGRAGSRGIALAALFRSFPFALLEGTTAAPRAEKGRTP